MTLDERKTLTKVSTRKPLTTIPRRTVHAPYAQQRENQEKAVCKVAKAYLDHIYSLFGGSVKILMDNGTEFKNKLFKEVVIKLGMEFSIHSPPYRPQSNGKIEGFHRFLKACIEKHINHGLEWNELTPIATACYNFFLNCSARESAFFIIFGRDPINKLNMMLQPATRYFYDDNSLPNSEALKNIYCYIVGLGLNCKFIDLLFKCLVIIFIKISSLHCFIVSEIIYSQTDTPTEELMDLS